MRSLFLSLATSATILATGLAPVAASEYRYCLHGDDYAYAGECGFTSYRQCQATASGRTAYCEANPDFEHAAVFTHVAAPAVPAKPHRR